MLDQEIFQFLCKIITKIEEEIKSCKQHYIIPNDNIMCEAIDKDLEAFRRVAFRIKMKSYSKTEK